MNHGLTLIVSFFSFVQTSFREFGEVGFNEIKRTLDLIKWSRICLPMQETRDRSLAQEDPLEEEMATHSSILAPS